MAFKPALFVVDMQNDFCSPQGIEPATGNGMDLVAPIKQLLSMPGFTMRIMSLIESAENHTVMAHTHKGATPRETYHDLPNPKEGMGHKTVKQELLRKICIKGSWGAQVVDGLQKSGFDLVATRNSHPDIWWSSLKDVHGNQKHELAPEAVSHHVGDELTSRNITHVFCVGIGGDYCVSHTAMDIADLGLKAYVIEDLTRSFDYGDRGEWQGMKKELKAKGVEVVKMDGPEVGRVKALGGGKGGNGTQSKMVFHGNFNGPVFFGYSTEQSKGLM